MNTFIAVHEGIYDPKTMELSGTGYESSGRELSLALAYAGSLLGGLSLLVRARARAFEWHVLGWKTLSAQSPIVSSFSLWRFLSDFYGQFEAQIRKSADFR
jgi:hypothetical protein